MFTEDMNVPTITDLPPPSASTKSLEMEKLLCSSCQKIHPNARLVMIDGHQVGNYSAEYRNFCEAKWVYAKVKNRAGYLEDIQRIRGEAAYEKLRVAMLKIHYSKKK
jgi:hypothetical protein